MNSWMSVFLVAEKDEGKENWVCGGGCGRVGWDEMNRLRLAAAAW